LSPSSVKELPPGTVVANKWRIEKLLGSGGMGAVYAATHLRNGREAAIKLLHPVVAADADAVRRFLLEGYAANKVGHAGCVQILDDGQDQNGAFLVMERLRGSSTERIAERMGERMPLLAVLAIADAALDVLSAAHRKGIVHRDFKPENLFLTDAGVLKVLDFGLARVMETGGAARLTATGVPMGTPAFMPPEQALAHWERVDARSDVFAIGASIYTLLSGQLVHPARTAPELLVMASTRQAAPLRALEPAVPPPIAHVVDRSLAFDPRHRFADATEMRGALHAAVRASGVTIPSLASLSLPTRADVPDAMLEEQSTLRNPTPEGATATGAPTTSDPALVRHARAGLLIAIAGAIGIGSVVVGSRYLGSKGSASHGAGDPPSAGASSFVTTPAEATAVRSDTSLAAEPPPGPMASAETPTVEPVPSASASAPPRPRPGASKPSALPKPTTAPTATPAPVTTSDDPLDNYRPK
jgi:serine/threonine-protein kinase